MVDRENCQLSSLQKYMTLYLTNDNQVFQRTEKYILIAVVPQCELFVLKFKLSQIETNGFEGGFLTFSLK